MVIVLLGAIGVVSGLGGGCDGGGGDMILQVERVRVRGKGCGGQMV